MSDPKKDRSDWAQMAALSTGGLLIAAGVIVGYLIGDFLDRRFKMELWTPIFVLLGAVGGFIELIRMVQRVERKK